MLSEPREGIHTRGPSEPSRAEQSEQGGGGRGLEASQPGRGLPGSGGGLRCAGPQCAVRLRNNTGLASVPSGAPLKAGHLCMHTHVYFMGLCALAHTTCAHECTCMCVPFRGVHTCAWARTCVRAYTHACTHTGPLAFTPSITGNTAFCPDASPRSPGCPDRQQQKDNMDGRSFVLWRGGYTSRCRERLEQSKRPLRPQPDRNSRSPPGFPATHTGGKD